MIIIESEFYTKDLLRSRPDDIFIFGDNMERYGKGGQAIIRYEPNAFGIATKRAPFNEKWAFFSDKADELDCVMSDLDRLVDLYAIGLGLNEDIRLVFPRDGIGTGLADMEKRSPYIWRKMCTYLENNFGFLNKGFQDNENSEIV